MHKHVVNTFLKNTACSYCVASVKYLSRKPKINALAQTRFSISNTFDITTYDL